MKRIWFSIVLATLILGATVFSFGQTQTGATAVIPSVSYEIVNQPDCPLNISIYVRMAARTSTAPLRITNNDSSTVTAFVLHVDGGPRLDHSYIVFVTGKTGKGLASGEVRTVAVSVRADPENTVKPVISLDYVLFVDGKTWGADSIGRSKEIKAFINGHDLAVKRLKKLLLDKDNTDFIRAIEPYGSSSSGAPVSNSYVTDFYARGYESVIKGLRRMSKRADEAKELARQLELMESSH